ncbi:MAG: cytochrome c biogenesis protein ResB [Bacteroidales bacterium]|nr:cytochrome c biogenesis protein ResB [Bacteroidales bacterium]
MTSDINEKRTSIPQKKKLWGYSESFSFAFGLVIAGFIIEYFTGSAKIIIPEWPVNLIFIVGYVIVTAVTYYVIKGTVVKWMVSIPSAIAAVSTMTIVVLFMGFIPQNDGDGFATRIGLTHVTRSWPYLMISLYLLTVLTFSVFKRLKKPFNLKKIAFLLNHIGLWIVIVAASLGTADLKRLNLYVEEGESERIAIDASRTQYKVPFEIELHDFVMEEYPPKIAIYSNMTGKLLKSKADKNPVSITPDLNTSVGEWEIEVKEYYPDAIPEKDKYKPMETTGATPAALLSVTNPKKNISRQGWVTAGNAWIESKRLPLSRAFTLVMLSPTAERYASELTIIRPDGEQERITLEVNKPYSFGSWKIYQSGYDSQKGKYSELSILELVYDPWLEVVYTGIFMLIFGSLYLMLYGKRK